jgi:hypothetical protein
MTDERGANRSKAASAIAPILLFWLLKAIDLRQEGTII